MLAPEDDLGWLALADCLEEEGRTSEAFGLRLVRQLHNHPREHPDRRRLERRLQDWLRKRPRVFTISTVNSLGMRMILIPPGRFTMGSPDDELERHSDEHLHPVELTRGFWMSEHLVTQSQYEQIMKANPSHFRPDGAGAENVTNLDTSTFPVECVTWRRAVSFCTRLSKRAAERNAGRVYRLPTEAEWEYACRAGTYSPFAFGMSLSSQQANVDGTTPAGRAKAGPYLARTCPVGSYGPNAFGLHDMHGQVWEWCSDWWDPEFVGPERDPTGPPEGTRHIMRGGSWYHYPHVCRSAARIRYAEEVGYDNGFRVVMDLSRPTMTPPSPRRTRARRTPGTEDER
jgi:formylglycine-generating enzyme required for sulfatase activity